MTYFISIAGIGMRATRLERCDKSIDVYNDRGYIFSFYPRFHQLTFHFRNEDTIFFDLIQR